MARTYQLKDHVLRRQENVLVECTCDICGKAGGPWDDFFDDAFFGDKVEVIIRFKEGTLREDGSGNYVEREYDVCADCFKGRIMGKIPRPPREENQSW